MTELIVTVLVYLALGLLAIRAWNQGMRCHYERGRADAAADLAALADRRTEEAKVYADSYERRLAQLKQLVDEVSQRKEDWDD